MKSPPHTRTPPEPDARATTDLDQQKASFPARFVAGVIVIGVVLAIAAYLISLVSRGS